MLLGPESDTCMHIQCLMASSLKEGSYLAKNRQRPLLNSGRGGQIPEVIPSSRYRLTEIFSIFTAQADHFHSSIREVRCDLRIKTEISLAEDGLHEAVLCQVRIMQCGILSSNSLSAKDQFKGAVRMRYSPNRLFQTREYTNQRGRWSSPHGW